MPSCCAKRRVLPDSRGYLKGRSVVIKISYYYFCGGFESSLAPKNADREPLRMMSSRVFVAFLLVAIASSSFGQDCDSDPCQQNADCVEDGLGYFCQCPILPTTFYTGQNCDENTGTVDTSCSMNYYDSEGNITSPNYPNDYDGRLECYSHLKIRTAEEITLILEVFETENLKDSLIVGAGPLIYEDSPTPADVDVYEFQGNLTGLPLENRTYTFPTNQISLYFNTDRNVHRIGYFITYTADIDSCIAEDPCLNNGTCVDGYYNYTCNCPMGYTGRNCEMELNECDSMPCMNGGVCMDLVNGHFCDCPAGFSGRFCQINDDECDPDPCVNGVCNDGINGYSCTCDPGWTDENCDENIDECASGPCQNGGSCTDDINMYTCACLPGYTDANCQTDIDECASSPCQNGATCNDLINMFTCDCAPGYDGDLCDNNINECASIPCMNSGICGDGIDEFECNCAGTGFEGTLCDINIDDCAPMPCQNGGDCTDLINDYNCTCMPGYTGEDCGIDIDECESDPCQNDGTCSDRNNSYMCACASGWTGPICDQDIDECLSTPCQNGGTCTDAIDGYTCECAAGYTNDMCQIEIDECLSGPCENGGTCVDEVNAYSCTCPPDTSGDNCEISLNACMSAPCQNGATCTNVGADFDCECPPGYAGRYCEIDINECSSLPCQNGATCNDSIAMFTCQCRFGFSGVYCEEMNFCDLEGEWYNECNDKLTITQTSTGMLLGDYTTNIEILTGMTAPTVALGFAGRYGPIPTFGFTVVRNNGRSTTSWTGQCQLCDREEVLYTTWINTEAATTCSEIKQATKIGQDKWTRYMQSQAPREDM